MPWRVKHLIYAALALGLAAGASAVWVDRQSHAAFARASEWPVLLVLREVVTPLGQTLTQALLLGLLWLWGILRKDPRFGKAAGLAAVCIAVAGIAAQVLKFVEPRARPYIPPDRVGAIASGYYHSFPSADAASAFAGAIAVGLIFPRARPWLLLAACVVAAMRVLRLAHWPSDVIAGAAVGVVAFMAVSFPATRGSARQDVSAEKPGASPSQNG